MKIAYLDQTFAKFYWNLILILKANSITNMLKKYIFYKEIIISYDKSYVLIRFYENCQKKQKKTKIYKGPTEN